MNFNYNFSFKRVKMGQSSTKVNKQNLKYDRWINSEINMTVSNIDLILTKNKKLINKLYEKSISKKIIISSNIVHKHHQRLFINNLHTDKNFWKKVSHILSYKYDCRIKIVNVPSTSHWKPDEFQIILT